MMRINELEGRKKEDLEGLRGFVFESRTPSSATHTRLLRPDIAPIVLVAPVAFAAVTDLDN